MDSPKNTKRRPRSANGYISMLVATLPANDRDVVSTTLAKFPPILLAKAFAAGVCIVTLKQGQTYCQASPELRKLGLDVDAWPQPPAGLFVIAEKTLYLRSRSEMTIAHEFSHAIDCALGDGTYLSSSSPAIRAAFTTAKRYVTPYAATGCYEFFAECLRAYVGANDCGSPWPPVSPARLKAADPVMFEIIERLAGGATC